MPGSSPGGALERRPVRGVMGEVSKSGVEALPAPSPEDLISTPTNREPIRAPLGESPPAIVGARYFF